MSSTVNEKSNWLYWKLWQESEDEVNMLGTQTQYTLKKWEKERKYDEEEKIYKKIQIVDRTLQRKKHYEFRRGIWRKIVSSRFSHQFIHILCIHLSQLMRPKQYWLALDTILYLCVSCQIFREFFPFKARHHFFFSFYSCTMKKFCSSLSSFRVICLQLNKICKFKAASDRKNSCNDKNSKK